ncbi:MAG: HD domain-containing protein, partial [Candidatus Aminicenantes bacterium]|nr:HD domain-containing protein [Candidatus Aminicenantes bacterium]
MKREIGSLQFKPDIKTKDLKSFLSAFSKKMEGTPEEVEQFHDTLRRSGSPSISLTKLSEKEKKRKPLGAKEIYFLSMSHLKDVFKMDEADKKSQAITTKRLIKAIYDNILDDSTFLLGLTTLKNFDDYTLNHCVNVSILALGLGKRMGLNKKELVELGISAFFHDIGKVSIPIDILNKPGELDDGERKIIETHPLRGAEQLVSMLQEGIVTPKTINVAMEHHAVSGSRGYPRYVKKINIDLFSKIV